MFRFSDPSENTSPPIEWDSKESSPVFGASANVKNHLGPNTSLSPSVLASGHKSNLKANPINNSRSEKVSPKSDDVALVAPLNLEPEKPSIITSQTLTSRQVILKANAEEPIARVTNNNNTHSDKDDPIKSDFLLASQKLLGSRCPKRKKTEERSGHGISCEKENAHPSRGDRLPTVNRDNTTDKPLDLSDRYSGFHSQEKGHTNLEVSKAKLKQATLYDVFQPIPVKGSSSLKGINGNCLVVSDSQDDLSIEEAMLNSLDKAPQEIKKQVQMKDESNLPLSNNDLESGGIKVSSAELVKTHFPL